MLIYSVRMAAKSASVTELLSMNMEPFLVIAIHSNKAQIISREERILPLQG
jgi:hypothetical protein